MDAVRVGLRDPKIITNPSTFGGSLRPAFFFVMRPKWIGAGKLFNGC
jgi:hypothetical protein